MAENKIFSDLDLTFVPNPHTGDLVPKVNIEAIKRSLRHIFQMNAFDIPFNAIVKSSLKNHLFEQNNQLTRSALESDLKWLINKAEPRVEVHNIDVKSEPNSTGFTITLTYKIKSMNQIDSFSFTVEKIR